MSKVVSTLKTIGLTPWQVVAAVAFCACWFTTLRPMPEAVAQLNATVADLSMKVEVHAVLIQQMSALSQDVSQVRQKLAELDGRMQATAYHKGNP